jgi:hypothetical protein
MFSLYSASSVIFFLSPCTVSKSKEDRTLEQSDEVDFHGKEQTERRD